MWPIGKARRLAVVTEEAYVPEHLARYVQSVTGAKLHIEGPYCVYATSDSVVVVGYPLPSLGGLSLDRAVERVARRFAPASLSVIGPRKPGPPKGYVLQEEHSDRYTVIRLEGFSVPARTMSMVRRAAREVAVARETGLGAEHHRLIERFLANHPVPEETERIFQRIDDYLAASPTSVLLGARDREGSLAAFDVAEFGAGAYAFYMFNFVSRDPYVPGASDLLLRQIIDISRALGKDFVNLGLGINRGVSFFKNKWEAKPFLDYVYARYLPAGHAVDRLLERLR